MGGETELDRILAELEVTRRPGTFAFVASREPVDPGEGVEAVIREEEGWTAVATVETARHRGWQFEFEAAWLTLAVHSSLEAVGLTAAVSQALADGSIPCNVLAGFYHDHLLVPVDRAGDAMQRIRALAEGEP